MNKFRLTVTWLPSSSEHVTRKNKKHKQRRNQGGQKDIQNHGKQVRRIDQIRYPMTEVASLSAVPQSCRTPVR